jgi:NTP pyrophosphatase (non-canonical NTP hydrolase)
MTIEELQKKITEFRDARDWKQFHNPKDIAISLSLEAGELMEHFQWKNKEEMAKHVKTHKKEISEEMADIFYWVLLASADMEIDLEKAFKEKMKINEKKYPVSKAKGKHTKYTEL